MNTADHPTTGHKHLAFGLLGVAAGITVGILATTLGTDVPASGVPLVVTSPADPARFGSPGHVTMSADAIEQWILHGSGCSPLPGRSPDPGDPARFGSPGHVTMSADAIEHWILNPSRPAACKR